MRPKRSRICSTAAHSRVGGQPGGGHRRYGLFQQCRGTDRGLAVPLGEPVEHVRLIASQGLGGADGSTLLSHGVASWECLRCLSLED